MGRYILVLLGSTAMASCSQPQSENSELASEARIEQNGKSSESLAGGAQSDFELQAVSACDLLLKRNLVSASSFQKVGTWRFSQEGTIGTVQRDYRTENALGVEIQSSYFCRFDQASQSVIGLKSFGPSGTKVILEDAAARAEVEALNRIEEGAERAIANSNMPQPTGSEEKRWIVNLQLTGCPAASDWFAVQDAVRAGRWDVELPSRCFSVPPGSVIVTPPEGKREQAEHNGHSYQKARLEAGRVFWTDELDSLSISPL